MAGLFRGLAVLLTLWGSLQARAEPVLPEPAEPERYPEYFTPLDRARELLRRGLYDAAIRELDAHATAPAILNNSAVVTAVRARALATRGRLDDALALLQQPENRDHEALRALHVELLLDARQAKSAVDLAKRLVERYPESIHARFLLGRALEESGESTTAAEAFAWFAEGPRRFLQRWGQDPQQRDFEDAQTVALIGQGLDRWATLTGAYQKVPQLHDTILSMLVRAYDQIDRDALEPRMAAAEFFLARSDSTKAAEEIAAVLEINPRHPRAMRVLCRQMIRSMKFDEADGVIALLQELNPTTIEPLLLRARSALTQRRPADAESPLREALHRSPDDLEALALLATTQLLLLREEDARRIIQQIETIDPDNALVYAEAGIHLSAARQYDRAAGMLAEAINRAPWWTEPRTMLGLLYTQSGDDERARVALEAARQLDPFNLEAVNYLRLLDDLAGYSRMESPHFVVVYESQDDPFLPEMILEYMESIHPEVCAAFGHQPAQKTRIELFPTHDAFSVRVTGGPWLPTTGASTGPVIAMVSPRHGAQTEGAYNWAALLRHEYTHTVSLAATDYRIAHWMTEGLAVVQEDGTLRWSFIPPLLAAIRNNQLVPVAELNWGFIRPKKPSDRTLAYAQSSWVCLFIEERWGREAISKMLEAYRRAMPEPEVFSSVLGVSTTQFDELFGEWARKRVEKWGYDPESTEKYGKLREAGEAAIKSREFARAVEIWEQIAAIRPVDQLPLQRLAGLYLSKEVSNPEKGMEMLRKLASNELSDNRYSKRLARISMQLKKPEEAVEHARHAIYIEPYDADAHDLLSKAAEAAGLEQVAQRHSTIANRIRARANDAPAGQD
jgi:tetratricopeptide (TPR) repeat protein